MRVCPLCPRHCALENGRTGACHARANREDVIIPLGYGQLTSLALDPIEKKPLARFHPGSHVLSVGSFGCNMACFFCQNAEISFAGEADAALEEMPPDGLVTLAASMVHRGNIGLAFTYNEPLLNHEYIRDCAALLRQRGFKTVLVTNGCFCLEELGDLLTLTDAMNIDLKGFSPAWYRRLGGDLETVKAFIKEAVKTSHVEVTTLVVPGENDNAGEIDSLSAWLSSLSPDIPLHLTRFFPRHKAKGYAPTEPAALLRLCDTARRHLRHVYAGNL